MPMKRRRKPPQSEPDPWPSATDALLALTGSTDPEKAPSADFWLTISARWEGPQYSARIQDPQNWAGHYAKSSFIILANYAT